MKYLFNLLEIANPSQIMVNLCLQEAGKIARKRGLLLDVVGEDHLHPGAHELRITRSHELGLGLQPGLHVNIVMGHDLLLHPSSCLVALVPLNKLLESARAIHHKTKQDGQVTVRDATH